MYYLFSQLPGIIQWQSVLRAYKLPSRIQISFIPLITQLYEVVLRSLLSDNRILSANDKVKVLWKTNCHWRDRPHWPKRKEIKLREGETEEKLLELNSGEMVKIKFGSSWYDAKIAEGWTPKAKKGVYIQFLPKRFCFFRCHDHFAYSPAFLLGKRSHAAVPTNEI